VVKKQNKSKPPSVTIVGGGISGITAALKLGARGYDVTLYEDRPILGGNLAAHWVDPKNGQDLIYHDVYPHMFSSFYTNFWDLVKIDLRIERDDFFEPRELFKVLRRDNTYRHMTDGTPVKNTLENLRNGPQPWADMVVYAYSLLDLMAEHGHQDKLLDQYSVNGFMRAKPYITERAAAMHDYALLTIWSAHSYEVSAAPYADFFRKSFRTPSPLTWVLKGDLHNYFIKHVEERFDEMPNVKYFKNKRVTRVRVSKGKVAQIELGDTVLKEGQVLQTKLKDPATSEKVNVENLLLSVSPGALGKLAQARKNTKNSRIVDYLPWLSDARQSRAEPIAVFNVYFKLKLKDIPREHTSLWESPMGLTFLDLSQLWDTPDYDQNGEKNTVLVVAASDYYGLPADSGTNEGQRLNISAMLEQLRKYLPQLKDIDFQTDVDWRKSHFLPNLDAELFVNAVGSESWRAKSPNFKALPNLYLAGGICTNPVGMATVEAAVTTGLNAAQAIHQSGPLGEPVKVPQHADFTDTEVNALKLLLMPSAYTAKWWSTMNDLVDPEAPKKPPTEIARDVYSLCSLPLNYGMDVLNTSVSITLSAAKDYLGGR
jgi:uncharacterized protein with NAD-binding domain and iron-sulfur cluster